MSKETARDFKLNAGQTSSPGCVRRNFMVQIFLALALQESGCGAWEMLEFPRRDLQVIIELCHNL